VSQVAQLLSLSGHTGYVRDVTFSPDGGLLASSGDDRTIRLWDVATGDDVHAFPTPGFAPYINSLAFSPDGDLLAFPQGAWMLEDFTPVVEFSEEVAHIAFSPDGQLLAVGVVLRPVKLYDTTTWTVLRSLESQEHVHWTANDSFGFEFSPDGTLLADGRLDAGTARLWSVESGALTETLSVSRPGTDVHDVAFSPDGRLLAAGGQGLEVLLFRVEDGGIERALPTGEGTMSLDFSPDGRLLAVSCEGVVSLWDVESGGRVRILRHDGTVLPVAFSPDGRYLACGVLGGKVVVWGLRE
jgi:WD40 repeat protein